MNDVTLSQGKLLHHTRKGEKWAARNMCNVEGCCSGSTYGCALNEYRFKATRTAQVREWLVTDQIKFGED